jgi:3-oxoacyl-[acyl-carrier-protein] synthase-3
MFIIEGLGQKKAGEWGRRIKEQLSLQDDQVTFLLYHSTNDQDHLGQFETVLSSGILDIDGMDKKIVKAAKIVARLYRLQLEEIGNV